jgi:hypothetical protein
MRCLVARGSNDDGRVLPFAEANLPVAEDGGVNCVSEFGAKI